MPDFIKEVQDLRRLDWSDTKLSPGTPGCFLKAYEEADGIRYYYKLSNYDSYRGVFGHECVNELIVSRLLDILKVEHLHYQLIHAKVFIDGKELQTYITRTENFRKERESKMAFDVFYALHGEKGESPLEFMARMGWERETYQMLAVDYLICNRDRHGANIELLIDENGQARPAPLFDHGLSLLFSCYDQQESILRYDVMEDKTVNSFVGARSPEYNLHLIPSGYTCFEEGLQEADREQLLSDLDQVLSRAHLEKLWEMIWRRWNRFEEVCGQKSGSW